MIDCVLIVVAYRSALDVAGLLATIPAAAEGLSWRTVVVNNDPDDDLRHLAETHPWVRVIEAGANLGYAGGINVGLDGAPPSRWTAFLNPDVRCAPGSISGLAAAADRHAAAVPAIRSDDGTRQRSLRREPSILGSLGDALFGNRWPSRPALLSEIVQGESAYEKPGSVDWATGAALLVPSHLVTEVGRWDDARFFLYSEETDYCRRLREAGARIQFVPHAVITHSGAGSGSSDALHALLEVNRVRYYRKWHGPAAATAFTGVVVLNNLLRSHRPRSRAALRAVLWPGARATLPGGAR